MPFLVIWRGIKSALKKSLIEFKSLIVDKVKNSLAKTLRIYINGLTRTDKRTWNMTGRGKVIWYILLNKWLTNNKWIYMIYFNNTKYHYTINFILLLFSLHFNMDFFYTTLNCFITIILMSSYFNGSFVAFMCVLYRV